MSKHPSTDQHDAPTHETLENEATSTSRRVFIKQAGLVMAGLALAGLARAEGDENDDDDNATQVNAAARGVVDVGPVASFKQGSVMDRTQAAGAMISRTANGLIALAPICTHEGCTPRLNAQGSFACPCHGAQFASDGRVMRGPARTPLSRYPIEVKNGRVLVNTNKLVRRSSVQKSDFVKV